MISLIANDVTTIIATIAVLLSLSIAAFFLSEFCHHGSLHYSRKSME